MEGCNILNIFPTLYNYHAIVKEECQSYKWVLFQNQDNEDILLKTYSSKQEICKLQYELNYYSALLQSVKYPDIIVFNANAITHNVHSNHAEILTPYTGIPISSLRKTILNKESNFFSQLLHYIMVESLAMLYNCKIIHGNISPDNIYFNPDDLSVSIKGGYSAKRQSEIPDYSYLPTFQSIYYQSYLSNNRVGKCGAISADIKALALSVYEILLHNTTLNHYSNKLKLNMTELYNATIAQQPSNELICKLISIFTWDGDMLYIKAFQIMSFQNATFPISLDCIAPIDRTNLFASYYPGMNVKQFSKFNVYYVEAMSGAKLPIIVKVYTNNCNYNAERCTFEKITSCNAQHMIKLVGNSIFPVQDKELAMEYGGITLYLKSSFAHNISQLLQHLMNLMYELLNDLYVNQIFHCDIKPLNIAISHNWASKLFDYDVTIADLKSFGTLPHSFDQNYTFKILGGSIEFASPEVLCALLGNKIDVTLNPWRADQYSLGKTLFCILTCSLSKNAILRNLYGADIIGEDKDAYNQYIKAKLSDEEKEAASKSTLLKIEQNKYEAMYFYTHNDKFVMRVQEYHAHHIESRHIADYILHMVSTNPNQRKNYEDFYQIYMVDYKHIKELYIPIATAGQIILLKMIKYNEQYTLQTKIAINHTNSTGTFIYCLADTYQYPLLYLIGGTDDLYEPTSDVYAIQPNGAIPITSMNYERCEFGATSMNNFIIVAGGIGKSIQANHSSQLYLDTVEMLDCRKNIWIVATGNMVDGRKNCTLVVNQGTLYIIGGIKLVENIELAMLYSKTIDIFKLSGWNIVYKYSIEIANDLSSAITNCSCVPAFNKLILLNNVLTDSDECTYEIKVESGAATIVKCLNVNTTALSWLSTAYNCHNCLHFIDNKYLYIPQFPQVEQSPDIDAESIASGIIPFRLWLNDA